LRIFLKKMKKKAVGKWLMPVLAAVLLASSFMTSVSAYGAWMDANAAVTSSTITAMRQRADAIVNYEWVPSQDIETWNNSLYKGEAVFKGGTVVKGMPYTLFVFEVVGDSLLSLEQYKAVASKNYSTTHKCASVGYAMRTGPVYGSCCATFVSEVLGGSFMNGKNPRYDSVTKINECEYGKHISNIKAASIRAGDALSIKGHIIWVGDVTDDSFVIYEQTPPVARKAVVSKATSVNSDGYLVYRNNVYKTATRINVTGTNLSVTAPAVSSGYSHYAENAQAVVSWPSVTNATYYAVDISKDGEPVAQGMPVTSHSLGLNYGNGSYEVYVTAVCGTSRAKSEPCRFKIGVLGTPVINESEQYFLSGAEVTASWNSCEGADGYRVTVTDRDGQVYRSDEVTGTAYSVSPEDGYYEMTVEAVNRKGGTQTSSSAKYCFNVGDQRPVIVDSSVGYFASGADVTVRWNDCEGVSDYTVQIAKDGGEYLSDTVSGRQSYELSSLPDGTYTAVVAAVESNGDFDWQPSEPYTFSVGVLDCPKVTSEHKYYGLGSDVTVKWKPCKGATGYRVSVSLDGAVIAEESVCSESFTFRAEEGRYSVTVTSVNDNGGHQERTSAARNIWATVLEIDKPGQTVNIGEMFDYHASAVDSDENDVVRWSSSDDRIASVDDEGTVTANGLGSAVITAVLGNMKATRTVDVVPALTFETLGASIRLTEPHGIRFGVRLEKDDAFRSMTVVEYGTLVIASGTLGNGELTLDTPSIRRIKAENTLENDDTHITYTGVLINIPQSFFATNVVGRGYLIYKGADDREYVIYSGKAEKSFNGVAQAAYDRYSSIQNPTDAQLDTIRMLREILNLG
jgi:Bacterial Ig-like domain (group 2).